MHQNRPTPTTPGKTKRGRAAYSLPPDFRPISLRTDAQRLGISVGTLRSAMMRQGIACGQEPAGRKAFVLPEGFVPTRLADDARRLGVVRATVAAAIRRQGIRPTRCYNRRAA